MTDQTPPPPRPVQPKPTPNPEQMRDEQCIRQIVFTATAAHVSGLRYAAARIVDDEAPPGAYDLVQTSPARPHDTYRNEQGYTSVPLWEADFQATLHPDREEAPDG